MRLLNLVIWALLGLLRWPNRWKGPIMKHALQILIALAASALVATVLASCADSSPQWGTVPGPETPSVVANLHGTVVTTPTGGGILAISLPSGKSRLIRPVDTPANHLGPVTRLAGPDKAGHVAFVEEDSGHYRLKVVSLRGGHERGIFTRLGSSFSHDLISQSFALSPVRSKVALISHIRHRQMETPELYLGIGTLEIWDIARSAKSDMAVTALDCGLSWFPDGKRLAYVQLDPASSVADSASFGPGFDAWPVLPAVYVLDTETGAKTRLGVGWYPIVSADGTRVLLHDGQYRPRLIAASGRGASKPVSLPGLWDFVIALDGDIAIYPSLPTAGLPPKMTKYNSPISGPKHMPSLKAGIINTKKFHTIIPYIDMRDGISFGAGANGK